MRFPRVESLIFIYSSWLLLGLFCFLAPQVFITESELWSIALGSHLWSDIRDSWVFTRPLFHFLLWLVQLPSKDPSFAVFATRSLFAFNGLLIAYLLLRISKQLTNESSAGYLALILLFGNTGFLSQGFRVRADLISATLALIALSWSLDVRTPVLKKSWPSLLPLLATPKGVAHILPLIMMRGRGVFAFFKKPLFFIGALSVCVLWIFLNWSNLIFVSHYFQKSYGPDYFDPDSWHHIDFQLRRNPHFWILFFCSGIAAIGSWKKRTLYNSFAASAFVVMLLAPGKSLFFIASFLPFFALQIGLFLKDLTESVFWNRMKRITALLATAISLLTATYWASTNLEKNNNREQLQVLSHLYSVLKDHPEISYFDGTCLIPSLCTYRYFIGPNQPEANRNAYEMLEFRPPSLVFYLEKSQYLEPELSEFLRKNYADIGFGVFIHMPHYENDLDGAHPSIYDRIRKGLPNRLDSLFGYDLNY